MTTQPERKSCLVCGKSCKVGKKDGLISSHGFRQMGWSNNSATSCIGSYMHWEETLNDLADDLDNKALSLEGLYEREASPHYLERAEKLRQTAGKIRRMAQK